MLVDFVSLGCVCADADGFAFGFCLLWLLCLYFNLFCLLFDLRISGV